MDRGVYAAASGGLLNSRRLEIVGNNLANANTVGFKAERLVSRQQEFKDTLAAALSQTPPRAAGDQARTPGVVDISTITDFSPGPVASTGNPLHVALREANQFFVVETPQGERYTRAGNFSMNEQGNLTTPDGMSVLGDGGALTLSGSSVRITSNGSVVVDGETAGRLRVVEVEDLTRLRRQEGVRFSLEGGGQATPVEASVVPQSVEMPNLSVVESMVQMISAHRSFEGYTKTLKTINELNEKIIRDAGRGV